jgi:hypothetical protein
MASAFGMGGQPTRLDPAALPGCERATLYLGGWAALHYPDHVRLVQVPGL